MQETLKNIIIGLAQQPSFRHHQRFVPYHLEIIEQICEELVVRYESNRDIVFALVRLHDYSKICSYDEETWFEKGYDLLVSCWYTDSISKQIIEYRKLFEQKMSIDLHQAPLEVQIVSSADAMSHYIWPFFSLYRHEHPEKSLEQFFQDNIKKLHKDFERKAVLPEARACIEHRLPLFREWYCGILPTTFLS